MSTDRPIGCDAAREALGPDPEARPGDARSAAAYEHYGGCEACRRYYRVQRALSQRLRRLAHAVGDAPAWLAERVRTALAGEGVRRRRRRLFAAGGATVLSAAAVGLFAVVASNDSTLQLVQPLAREAHIGLARPTSIESTDTTVLRAWLEHEVGYAVAIPSISEAEVVGATVAEMDGVRGAAVVYRYRGSALTYFDLPAAEPSRSWTGRAPVTSASADGYQVALWTEDGGARAVAAPMPRAEVVKVAKECREKAARAGS